MVRKVAQQVAARVSFSVEYARGLRLGGEVRARLERVLRDLCGLLDALPERSSYLTAIDGQIGELNLQRWQIEYRVDCGARRITVTDARRRTEAA